MSADLLNVLQHTLALANPHHPSSLLIALDDESFQIVAGS